MGKDEFLCIDDIFAYKRCKEQCEQCKEVEDNENQNRQSTIAKFGFGDVTTLCPNGTLNTLVIDLGLIHYIEFIIRDYE